MNKTIILLTIILASINYSIVLSQPQQVTSGQEHFSSFNHHEDDSLLFDGNYNTITKPVNITEDCKIKVTYSFGTVEGTKYVTKVYDICGEIDTGMSAKKSKIHTGDFIKYGEELTTGDNSGIDIELWNGDEVKLGPNSSVVIEDYMCEGNVLVQMKNGTMWNKVKKLLGGKKYEVKTQRAVHGVRGTEFTVSVSNDEDIVKVYEGTVEVSSSKKNTDKGSTAKEMQQLMEDYKTGKITKEEYTRKLQDFVQNANKKVEELTNKMCTAGNMVRVTYQLSEISPFDTSGDRWFDNANFK